MTKSKINKILILIALVAVLFSFFAGVRNEHDYTPAVADSSPNLENIISEAEKLQKLSPAAGTKEELPSNADLNDKLFGFD